MNPPTSWPGYRLNPKVKVKSGDRTPKTGIYLPDVDHGFPALLIASDQWNGKATEASIPSYVLPDGSRQHWAPATWTLVERIADSGGGIPGADDPAQAGIRLRCEAGRACPRAGWWFSPAKLNSRRIGPRKPTNFPDFDPKLGTIVPRDGVFLEVVPLHEAVPPAAKK